VIRGRRLLIDLDDAGRSSVAFCHTAFGVASMASIYPGPPVALAADDD
jgi:hypothetical protein